MGLHENCLSWTQDLALFAAILLVFLPQVIPFQLAQTKVDRHLHARQQFSPAHEAHVPIFLSHMIYALKPIQIYETIWRVPPKSGYRF